MSVRIEKEKGGVILGLVAVAALALLAGAVYVASIGYGSLILSELQAAADAAAHASATGLMSDNAGWVRARSTAIETLNKQFARGNLGESSTISIDPTSTDTTWSMGSLQVSIERGRWVDASGFESFENWEIDTPGRPGFLAFNAVQVTVERVRINSILSTLVQTTMNLGAEAVGVAGRIEDVCIPPLAVPACSLVDPNGNFDILEGRGGVFLFTETRRYCPAGNPDCGAAPAFLYDSGYRTAFSAGVVHDGVRYPMGIGATCGWPSPVVHDSVPDSFGVVGVAYRHNAVPPALTEPAVRQAIADFSPHGCDGRQLALVGDRFQVFPPGLTESESEEVVWKKVWDFPLGEDPDISYHRLMGSFHQTYNLYNPIVGSTYQMPTIQSQLGELRGQLSTTCPDEMFRPMIPAQGLCRSRRVRVIPDTCGYRLIHHPTWSDDTRCLTEPLAGQGLCLVPILQGAAPYDYPRSWAIKVPVIADISPDASFCQGTGDGSVTVEPFLDTSHPLEIIGFVTSDIFDVDIGGGFPVNVDWMNGCPTEFLGEPFGFSRSTSGDGSEGRCNAIRGRNIFGIYVLADTDFPNGVSEPRLVRQR